MADGVRTLRQVHPWQLRVRPAPLVFASQQDNLKDGTTTFYQKRRISKVTMIRGRIILRRHFTLVDERGQCTGWSDRYSDEMLNISPGGNGGIDISICGFILIRP